MIEKLVAFEERLTRVEAALLVGVVIFMLVMAVYNVFYRNALIPLQYSIIESATVDVEVPIEPSSGTDDGSSGFGGGFGGGFGESATDDSDDADDTGGFGGGFGGGFDDEPDESAPDDEAGGFGGGFGGGSDDDPDDPDESVEPDDSDEPVADDGAGGFGGGFDDESSETSPEDEAGGFGGGFGSNDDDSDGFGGGFGGGFDDAAQDSPDAADAKPTTRIERRGPEEGSFARGLADFIDTIKLEWIDVVLRQLVLVIGFLGSMLATRRRKHITIDALSKVLPVRFLPWVQVLTNLLSIGVCVFLMFAGWGLVEIGLEFPKELTWFAEEWVFQLVFPVGFGLLAFHFGVRLVESVAWGVTGEPVGTIELETRPIATSATAGDLDLDEGILEVPAESTLDEADESQTPEESGEESPPDEEEKDREGAQ